MNMFYFPYHRFKSLVKLKYFSIELEHEINAEKIRKNIFSLFDRYIIEQLSIHEFICLKFDPNLVTKAVSYKLHKK